MVIVGQPFTGRRAQAPTALTAGDLAAWAWAQLLLRNHCSRLGHQGLLWACSRPSVHRLLSYIPRIPPNTTRQTMAWLSGVALVAGTWQLQCIVLNRLLVV